MSWRLANSLVTLRNQVNEMYPNRNKASDGTIGDAAHQAEGSASDHNPWLPGEVVSALDLTHDPANGLDIDKFSDVLAESKDPRIKYLIANREIWQANTGWQPYGGSDPHTNHIHISVNTNNYDDGSKWNLKKEEIMPNDGDVTNVYQLINGRPATAQEKEVYTKKPISAPDGLLYGKLFVDIKNLQKAAKDSQGNTYAPLNQTVYVKK